MGAKNSSFIQMAVGATLLFTPFAGVGVMLMASGALTLAAYALSPKPKQEKVGSSLENNGHLLNTQSSKEPVYVIYGKFKAAGNIVYAVSTGDNSEWLHLIVGLCEGEVEGLDTEDGFDRVYLDDKRIDGYGSDAAYEFYPGSDTQDICGLSAYDPSWEYKLRGTAYLYVRVRWNAKKFIGRPNVTAIIKGRKLYDPRDGTTAYSTNPALVYRDAAVNSVYGAGYDAASIDDDAVKSAANWCDSNGYEFNGGLFSRQRAADMLDEVLKNFRAAAFRDENGKNKPLVLDYDAPVMDVGESDVVEDSFTFGQPGVNNTPNRIRIVFPDIDNEYKSQEIILETDDYLDTGDNERIIDVELTGTVTYEQAYKLGAYFLERAAWNRQYGFAMGSRGLLLDPGDLIRVTHGQMGWTDHVVRVTKCSPNPDGTVTLGVLDEKEELYDDTVNVSAHTPVTTTLPDPLAPPPHIAGAVITETLYTLKDNTFVQIDIEITPPPNAPFWKHAEIWVSEDGYGYSLFGLITSKATYKIGTKDGQTLFFKFVSVSISGVKNDSGPPVYTYSVLGKHTNPPDVDNFYAIASGDVVNLRWSPVTEIDLAGYEIRFTDINSDWVTSTFVQHVKAVGAAFSGVKPGTHRFLIKAKDSLGQYGDKETAANVQVFWPSGYSHKAFSPYTDDFSGAEARFYNTERYNDPVQGWVLKLSDPANEGYYISSPFDLGSSIKARHWCDYELYSSGLSLTWDQVFSNCKTWDDVFGSGKTWNQVFNVSRHQTDFMEMTFLYSDDDITYTEIKEFHLLSPEVQARYFKYRVNFINVVSESFLYLKPVTLNAAYWQ